MSAPEDDRPLKAFAGASPPAPEWFHWAVGQAPERAEVVVNGARIETLAWGERGRPGVLLLHGGWAHADWWSFIAPFLAENRRVASMSWSGMGGSDWRDSYSMDGFVEEAFTAADSTGLFDGPEKPLFAGHSFGGHVALACAVHAGERLKAAATIDTIIRPPGAEGRPPREPRQNRVYPTFEAAIGAFRFMPRQTVANLYLADFIARRSLKPAPDAAGGMTGWTWRFDPLLWSKFDRGDVRAPTIEAKCPLVTFWGGRSALITSSLREAAAKVLPPGTPSIVIPDSNHHVLVDQPLALISALRTLDALV
ncbi:MAG: alpha/beta hydrolase [Caulobacteraceae bacterium]